jgi:putative copper export protein
VGEAGSAAVLAMAVLGLAIFIAAVAIIASGLTMAGRYGDSPPPNVGELGYGQVIGGAAMVVLSVALVASALAVLADVRGSRRVAAAVAGLTALISAAGVFLVMSQPVTDTILASALAVVTLVCGVSAIVLGRPRP